MANQLAHLAVLLALLAGLAPAGAPTASAQDASSAPQIGQTCVVNPEALNVRDLGSMQGKKVGSLKAGDSVTIMARNDAGWVMVAQDKWVAGWLLDCGNAPQSRQWPDRSNYQPGPNELLCQAFDLAGNRLPTYDTVRTGDGTFLQPWLAGQSVTKVDFFSLCSAFPRELVLDAVNCSLSKNMQVLGGYQNGQSINLAGSQEEVSFRIQCDSGDRKLHGWSATQGAASSRPYGKRQDFQPGKDEIIFPAYRLDENGKAAERIPELDVLREANGHQHQPWGPSNEQTPPYVVSGTLQPRNEANRFFGANCTLYVNHHNVLDADLPATVGGGNDLPFQVNRTPEEGEAWYRVECTEGPYSLFSIANP